MKPRDARSRRNKGLRRRSHRRPQRTDGLLNLEPEEAGWREEEEEEGEGGREEEEEEEEGGREEEEEGGGQDNDGMRTAARRIPTRSPRYLVNKLKADCNS